MIALTNNAHVISTKGFGFNLGKTWALCFDLIMSLPDFRVKLSYFFFAAFDFASLYLRSYSI